MIESIVNKFRTKNVITAVFLGDSVTAGYFESSKDKMHSKANHDMVYHNRLKKILNFYFPEKIINIINSGIGGQTSTQGLQRIEEDVISHNPDFVVVCFGLNDASRPVERYIENMSAIFEELTKRKIDVIYMTPNMLNTAVVRDILPEIAKAKAELQNSGQMDIHMEAGRKTAKQYNIPICDCYNYWKTLNSIGIDTNRLLANGINHPVEQMHWLFAAKLFDTIFI